MAHSRTSDTQRLIKFAKDQGWDCAYVMEAVMRLERAISEELTDYSIPESDNEPEYGD